MKFGCHWLCQCFRRGGQGTVGVSGTRAPFNRLQIGAPSGITSAHEVVVDNILLELIDVAPPPTVPGDFDGDGDVDGADFVIWQTNFPFTPGPAVAPVPESSAFLLAIAGFATLLVVRLRKPTGASSLRGAAMNGCSLNLVHLRRLPAFRLVALLVVAALSVADALTLGILLDTFVVGTILVPAFLALLARQETP